jgi:hypothetical protein
VERLPDKAAFNLLYDAETTSWTGTLTVDGQVFEGQGPAVFKLMALLDAKYRRSLEPA